MKIVRSAEAMQSLALGWKRRGVRVGRSRLVRRLGECRHARSATIALVGGPRLIDELARRLTGSDNAPGIAQQMVLAGGIVIFFLVTIALYVFGPNARRRPLMTEVPGALLAVAGWIVVTRIFAEYVDRFESFDAVYGSLGFVVVYLVFLWLTGLLVVIGAEINEELYDERRRRRAFR
jgi:membrane protein